MADWSGAIMTKQGRALEAKVTAGICKLELTKLKVGDGEPHEIESMTDLAAPKLDIGISSISPTDAGICDIEGVITNAELEKGFYMRELGIYATDPEEGEILYAVATDSHADYLQAKGSSTTLSVGLHVQVVITNADSVMAIIDPKGLTTRTDLAAHDESDAAHENRFKLFEKIATLGDDIIKKLALTTTITAIKALETNSWFGQLLKMVLTASGVRYLAAQNGYICFGSFFGNLIIQWGHGYQSDVYYPVAFNLLIPRILTQHEGIDFYQTKPSAVSLTRFTLTVVGDGTAKDADWYAVGA
ncbi:phage tail protein [Acidaminococcus intestini]|uniref:phage tail-collar fiber domain-containing protein n=1 Tax=Acidaminococcus intestini TaxID=187327 RepID=UPI002F93EBD4